MVEIVRFPRKQAQHGNVWCEPLGMYFPKIFRLSETASNNAEAAATHFYTLDPRPSTSLAGYSAQEIQQLDPHESHSLILRHHWSETAANSYLEGVDDFGEGNESPVILVRDDAVFTLTDRVTRRSWPGPMIIYVADIYDSQNDVAAEHFEVVIGPDGRQETRDLLAEG
ncbi:MAG: hypothetical protein ACR65Z_06985 [Methylocystis sp.]